jgi:hypothetical protein
MSNPGGTFSTGPSTSPVLSEPAAVVDQGAPSGPAPSTGPLQAYVDAPASTDAQKTALLASIAQLGSVGKQAYVQQQAQTQQARLGAISSINAATGQAGTSAPAAQAITAAFQGQATSGGNQQQSLSNYQNQVAGAAGNWYNQVGAAIPIMQERTAQQVNSFYAAQRLAAQNAAIAAAQTQADKQAQIDVANANAAAAGSRAQTAATQGTTAATNATAAQYREETAAAKYGATGGTQVSAANKAIGANVDATPGWEPGSKNNDTLWNLLGATDPTTGKSLTQAQTLTLIDNLYGKKGVRTDNPAVAGVDRAMLTQWVNSYFSGTAQPTTQTYSALPAPTLPQAGGMNAAAANLLPSS